jgi:uncharacterized membrane protein
MLQAVTRLRQHLETLGVEVADRVSFFVGTWRFIFLYTLAMVLWIVGHESGYLQIDTPDYIQWGLWLNYFAGTQASLVLMSSARQANIDRRKAEHNYKIDKKTLAYSKANNEKIEELTKQVEMLEEIIDALISKVKE